MDLLTIVQAVFRRWYVAVPIGLAALGIAVYLQSNIPPQYQAAGQILLAEPRLDPSRLPSAAVDLSGTLALLEDEAVSDQLATDGAEFTVLPAEEGTVSILATATQPAPAIETVQAVTQWLDDEVTSRQVEVGISDDERLRVRSLTPLVGAVEQDDGTYQSVGSVLIQDPSENVQNPYAASTTTGRLLEVSLESDAGRARVNELTGGYISYDIGQSARDVAPIMEISTFGTDPERVLAGFEQVSDVLAEELDARQARADVPPSRRVIIEEIAAPQQVMDVSPPLDRSVAVVVGLGGLLAVSLALALDGLMTRRHRRAGAQGVGPGDAWWQNLDRLGGEPQSSSEQEPVKEGSSTATSDPR